VIVSGEVAAPIAICGAGVGLGVGVGLGSGVGEGGEVGDADATAAMVVGVRSAGCADGDRSASAARISAASIATRINHRQAGRSMFTRLDFYSEEARRLVPHKGTKDTKDTKALGFWW